MAKYKLFLDDIRSVSMVYKNLADADFIIARTFEDFKSIINHNGLPEFISFDNDLGLDSSGNVAPDGNAAAKWLVFESGLDISELKFYVHSANIVAKDQINGLLNNYIRHLNSIKKENAGFLYEVARNDVQLKTDLYLIRIVAKAYNTLNYKLIYRNASKDIAYESQWVLSSLNGRGAVSKYLRHKFITIKKTRSNVFAEIGLLNYHYPGRPCIILSQGRKEDKNCIILLESKEGKIKRIDICAVPHWSEAAGTNEYPL